MKIEWFSDLKKWLNHFERELNIEEVFPRKLKLAKYCGILCLVFLVITMFFSLAFVKYDSDTGMNLSPSYILFIRNFLLAIFFGFLLIAGWSLFGVRHTIQTITHMAGDLNTGDSIEVINHSAFHLKGIFLGFWNKGQFLGIYDKTEEFFYLIDVDKFDYICKKENKEDMAKFLQELEEKKVPEAENQS